MMLRTLPLYSLALLLLVCVAGLGLSGCPSPSSDSSASVNPALRLFHIPFKYTTLAEPYAVTCGDFNRDGRLDLAAISAVSNEVGILMSKESGGFRSHVDYAVGDSPAALKTVDFNGDGYLDLLTANRNSNDVSILLGCDTGKFLDAISYPLPADAQPQDLLVLDVNGDTHPDLITANFGSANLTLYPGLNGGALGEPLHIPVGNGPRSVAADDLDRDGVIDLVAANRNDNTVSICYGSAEGKYSEAVTIDVESHPRMVGLADLNNDAWPDLVVSNANAGTLSIILSLGARSYATPTSIALNALPTRFVLADLDGDNHTDIAVLLFSEETSAPIGVAAFLKGDGKGAFAAPRYFGAGASAFDIIAVDMDGDARLDLITTELATSRLALIYATGKNVFETDERFTCGERPRVVRAVDINNDGALDLVVANLDSRDIAVLIGHGDATFDAPLSTAVGGSPRDFAIADFNGDSHLDVAVLHLYKSQVQLLLGNSTGAFTPGDIFSVRASGGAQAYPRSIVAADMNQDQIYDLIVGNSNRDSIAILLGAGNATFAMSTEYKIGNFPLSVAAVELNKDGKKDVVCLLSTDPDNPASSGIYGVVRVLGNGDGTLDDDSREMGTISDLPQEMALADLDSDGDYDAVSSCSGKNGVFVNGGSPKGTFYGGKRWSSGDSPNSVSLHDVNDDHLPDIITTNSDDTVAVLLNRDSLDFSPAMTYFAGTDAIGTIAADVDGDGKQDLILLNRSTDDISIVRGANQ